MRTQTNKLQKLLSEFNHLKKTLFGEHIFVVMDEDSKEVKRYNQLLQFFHPHFRTSDYVNLLNETNDDRNKTA